MGKAALVIGVRSKPVTNLGWEVSDVLNRKYPGMVANADFEQDWGVDYIDVRDPDSVEEVFSQHKPQVVVYCAGINKMTDVDNLHLRNQMNQHFLVNVTGMMNCLQAWIRNIRVTPGQFIGVVSNSARIPRTRSLPYCASKAAQAMALRVAARELAGVPGWVYGYEPGLVGNTPMTVGLPVEGPMHRMKGVGAEGVSKFRLAEMIVENIGNSNEAFNGVLFPFDAGEL